jgi:TRAP-type mannitol/chloroaromatic compound transport system permease large subunit
MSAEFVAVGMFVGLLIGLFMGHPLAFVLGGLAVIFGNLGLLHVLEPDLGDHG